MLCAGVRDGHPWAGRVDAEPEVVLPLPHTGPDVPGALATCSAADD